MSGVFEKFDKSISDGCQNLSVEGHLVSAYLCIFSACAWETALKVLVLKECFLKKGSHKLSNKLLAEDGKAPPSPAHIYVRLARFKKPTLLSVGQHVEGLKFINAGGRVKWYICFGEQ